MAAMRNKALRILFTIRLSACTYRIDASITVGVKVQIKYPQWMAKHIVKFRRNHTSVSKSIVVIVHKPFNLCLDIVGHLLGRGHVID